MSKARRVDERLLTYARNMRAEPSLAEKKLWTALRAGRLNETKWKRQVVIGDYIADFLCVEASLIVELDGESHDTSADYDENRTRALAELGLRVVRFRDEDVLFKFQDVLRTIVIEYNESKATHARKFPLP